MQHTAGAPIPAGPAFELTEHRTELHTHAGLLTQITKLIYGCTKPCGRFGYLSFKCIYKWVTYELSTELYLAFWYIAPL